MALESRVELLTHLAVSVVAAGLAALPVQAESNRESRIFAEEKQHVERNPGVIEGGRIETVFSNRWVRNDDDFVVRGGALIARGEAEARSGVTGKREDTRGHRTAMVVDDAAWSEAHLGVPEESALKHNSNIFAPIAVSKVAECAPSPLSPAQIRALVGETAQRLGVDRGFATAIAWTESNFDRNRNSPEGARGPMQLMPETARRYGIEDICDPAANIRGGVEYLRDLLEEFRNPLLAAAAYNAGEAAVYAHGGIPPFPETVGYVAKVVNRQLGLPMPGSAPRRSREAAADTIEGQADDGEAGVILTGRPGAFVGGVMHF